MKLAATWVVPPPAVYRGGRTCHPSCGRVLTNPSRALDGHLGQMPVRAKENKGHVSVPRPGRSSTHPRNRRPLPAWAVMVPKGWVSLYAREHIWPPLSHQYDFGFRHHDLRVMKRRDLEKARKRWSSGLPWFFLREPGKDPIRVSPLSPPGPSEVTSKSELQRCPHCSTKSSACPSHTGKLCLTKAQLKRQTLMC